MMISKTSDISSAAARNLSAAVIRLAVEDMQSLYKKTMGILSLDRQGKLERQFLSNPNAQKFNILPDEISSIRFLAEKAPELFFDIVDIQELPATINLQIKYCQDNLHKAQSRLTYLKGRATKQILNKSL